MLIDNAAVVLFFEAPLKDILTLRVLELVGKQAKLPAGLQRLFFLNRRFWFDKTLYDVSLGP